MTTTNHCPGGGGHYWTDALPGVWCNEHGELRDLQREAEKRAAASRDTRRSWKDAQAEYLNVSAGVDPDFYTHRTYDLLIAAALSKSLNGRKS